MKLWFPNGTQWLVMWVGLVAVSVALSDALGYAHDNWAGVVFVLGATVFILWMLEGRKRKAKSKEDAAK
jgi:hypothetical protein